MDHVDRTQLRAGEFGGVAPDVRADRQPRVSACIEPTAERTLIQRRDEQLVRGQPVEEVGIAGRQLATEQQDRERKAGPTLDRQLER